MSNAIPNGSYWSPSREKRWVSYWALQPDFPNVSLPMNMDIPDLDVYQIYSVTPEDPPEGFYMEWNQIPEQGEDGLWYESYKFVPIPETTEE